MRIRRGVRTGNTTPPMAPNGTTNDDTHDRQRRQPQRQRSHSDNGNSTDDNNNNDDNDDNDAHGARVRGTDDTRCHDSSHA
ncbi:hypothetical protein ACIP69_23625 [Streptomyces hygroscopicus]|uniref:hypothetical protein n=1 Tax=Streptomyces hygroscopicus TaxID=1912 RepID=UPI0037F15C00